MRISPHFSLAEFAVSASHPHLVRPVPAHFVSYARLLVVLALAPLRAELGRPVRILSGYRDVELNKAAGGSPTSQHTMAQAVDVTTGGAEDIMRYLVQTQPKGIGQVIYYPERQFVHIGLISTQYPQFTPFLSTTSKVYRPMAPTEDDFDRMLRSMRTA
jgi:hypothetical protein